MKLSNDVVVLDSNDCYSIYNYFTNKLSRVHKEIYDFLVELQKNDTMDNTYDALTETQINTLIDHGVLIDNEKEYLLKKFVPAYHEVPAGTLKKIEQAYLHLTMNCNLSCEYCYMRESTGCDKPYLSTCEWIKVLDILREVNVNEVMFTGGEVFLHEGVLDIIKHAKAIGFNVVLLTNGTLMTGEILKTIEYTDKVIVSLDGVESSMRIGLEQYNVLDNIYAAHKMFPGKIQVRSVVVRGKEADYEALKNVLTLCRIPHKICLCIPCCEEETDVIPDYNNYPSLIGKGTGGRCTAGNSIIALDAQGNIFPCQTLIKPELFIANIFDRDWKEKHQNCNVNAEVNSLDLYSLTECKACEILHLCGGGCRAIAYDVYRDFRRRNDFLCDYYKKCTFSNLAKERNN